MTTDIQIIPKIIQTKYLKYFMTFIIMDVLEWDGIVIFKMFVELYIWAQPLRLSHNYNNSGINKNKLRPSIQS